MAGVQDWKLAAAVAEGGGLGSIPCAMLDVQQIGKQLSRFRGDSPAPVNLNFFCHEMPEPDSRKLKAWEIRLSDYYKALRVDPPAAITGLRRPFDEPTARGLEAYLKGFHPPVMSFHFGLPSAELVRRIKSWGSVILSSATTLEEGLWLQEHGADVVIAQGMQAGGHRAMFLTDDPQSQLPTRELVAQLTQTLSVPVVAAGGLATAADIREAMRWGAAGAQLGTTYLACDEADTSRVHRNALADPDSATELTNVFSGRLARGISNRVMRELGFVSPDAPPFPYAAVALAPLRKQAESRGLRDFSPLWAGTRREGCREISATQLTRELWAP